MLVLSIWIILVILLLFVLHFLREDNEGYKKEDYYILYGLAILQITIIVIPAYYGGRWIYEYFFN